MAGLRSWADKAKQYISKNPDKARKGIDRASKFADEKTGGKYTSQIDKGTERAKGYVQGQGGEEQGQGQGQSQQGQQPEGGGRQQQEGGGRGQSEGERRSHQ